MVATLVNMPNAGVCVQSFVETCMWMCKTFIVFAHLFFKHTCGWDQKCVGCFQNPGRSTLPTICYFLPETNIPQVYFFQIFPEYFFLYWIIVGRQRESTSTFSSSTVYTLGQ